MNKIRAVSLLLLYLAVSACANQPQMDLSSNNAFLNDYVLSKEGLADHKLLGFWKKNVVWTAYKKVIVEPVAIKLDVSSGMRRVQHAEKAQLQEMLEFRLRQSVKPVFKLANAAGESTLRMEFMVTEAATANALIAELQAIHPPANVVTVLNALLTRSEEWKGKSNIVGKITDSTTGEVLMVVVDQYQDENLLEDFMILWNKVGKHYRYWTWQLGYQLCVLQQLKYCQKP